MELAARIGKESDWGRGERRGRTESPDSEALRGVVVSAIQSGLPVVVALEGGESSRVLLSRLRAKFQYWAKRGTVPDLRYGIKLDKEAGEVIVTYTEKKHNE